ncbi:PAQR family membrane homeostasis protein TrhA [Collinsella intestinalis]|uniref:PAQR family membrane homeostasis protein TrhA n=1 Tax=Collinsella intestinalis TaxID=147207 RepID=UPI001EF711A6|nr:hemolysin III family protein [Collinsella intestinalis]
MSASGDSSLPRSTSGAADAPASAAVAGDAPAPAEDDVCATCRKRRRSCPKYPRPAKDEASSGLPLYTLGEEIANAITHGIGVLLAIAGLVLLIVKAALGGAEPTHIASAIVFGVTLILEYLASTLYHAIQVPAAKRVFRIIDHSSIYLLIAGSYTPFCLITLARVGGVPLFVVVWALAIVGISFEIIGRQRQPRWVTILIYLFMGWLVVFRLPQLIAALDPVALALLAVGGLCYTVGCAFYVMKHIRYMHSVWHLWVLAGSIFQFMAVILYVI